MDIQSKLALSYYKEIASINEPHNISLVQHIENGHIFVKKVLSIYNLKVFEDLLQHPIPHTPHIIDLFEDSESHTLTVIEEYISGETLEELMTRKTFSDNEVTDLLLKLCAILKSLHSKTPVLIHRDIKPSNVILAYSGEIYLLDWNAAKFESKSEAKDTMLIGTKGYAAPEQYGFGSSNKKTDIYALGMLANALLAGKQTTETVASSTLSDFIRKCTQLDPEQRYSSIDEIEAYLQFGNTVPSIPTSAFRSFLPPGFRSGNPLYMVLASVGYLMILFFSVGAVTDNAPPIINHVNNICFFFMMMSVVFISCNYRGIQMHFPLCRTKSLPQRILAVIFLDIATVFVLLCLMLLLNFIILKVIS